MAKKISEREKKKLSGQAGVSGSVEINISKKEQEV
jgi:hypothetical protein